MNKENMMSKESEKYCVNWNKHQNISFVDKPVHHLVVALFPDEVIKLKGQDYVCTSSFYLLKSVSKFLKCSINFYKSEQDFGGQLRNGTWTGILGLLANQSADVVLQFFSFNKDREKVIDFVNYFPSQHLISILSVPVFRPENVLKIFFIFGPRIWTLLFLSFIAYSAVNALVLKDNIKRLAVSVDYFGLLTGQASYYLNRNHLSILVCIWLTTTFILRQLFTSDIQALLLAKREIDIDHIEQLIDWDNIIPIVEKESSVHRTIVEDYPELAKRSEKISHIELYGKTVLQQVLRGTHVLLISESVVEQITSHYFKHRWHKSKDNKISLVGNFASRIGLNQNIRTKLHTVFHTLFHNGIYFKESNDEINFHKFMESLRNTTKRSRSFEGKRDKNMFEVKMRVRELLVCFVLFSVGSLFSLIVFVLEVVIFIKNRVSLSENKLFVQPLKFDRFENRRKHLFN